MDTLMNKEDIEKTLRNHESLKSFTEKDVPRQLSKEVRFWTIEDVGEWVRQIGGLHYCDSFQNRIVDGELLLQLIDSIMKEDMQMKSVIIRGQFLREISK